VKSRRQQQTLDPLWHRGEHQPTAGTICTPMRADENAKTGGIDELDATQVDQEITDAAVNRLGQGSAHISNSGRA
jgi:hypothetical protein